MKRLSSLLVLSALLLAATGGHAQQKWEDVPAEQPEKLFWRNSLLVYENAFSAHSLSRSVDLTYNPYYAQSFSFRPRFYIRDDLSIRPRLDLEIELTTSDDTDHAREWIVSDFYLDTVWMPKFLTIPVVGVRVSPSLRLIFPTSIESRGRSMVMLIGPGFGLRREFALAKGPWFSSVDVGYGFRFNKYLHRYASATIAELEGCENINRPECQHRGRQNLSWRFVNSIDATLRIHEKVSFGVSLLFYNNLLHQIPEQTVELAPGTAVVLPPSRITHTAATWAIFDVSYDLFDWLSLSVGTSTFYGQLAADSTYRTPLFNRYTNFYIDVTIPVDAFYQQVRRWAGKGSARRPSAEMRGPNRLLATGY